MSNLEVPRDGLTVRGESTGEGPTIILLHGLTATRRYVLHGSTAIPRAGFQTIAMDARGHGASDPAPERGAYRYTDYVSDVLALMDHVGVARAVLAGVSMGAAAAAGVALAAPERVKALVLITPAHRGVPSPKLERWDALADGLEGGGVDGFLAALGDTPTEPRFAETVRTVIAQRLGRHEHPSAVADALRATPRSTAFDGLDALASVGAPTLVVGSQDGPDPDHPLAVAQEWSRRIPEAKLIVETPEESPLAWRGGTLSGVILDFLG